MLGESETLSHYICLFALFTSKACKFKGGMITTNHEKGAHGLTPGGLKTMLAWLIYLVVRDKANSFAESKPDPTVLRALLGACAYHGNLEIGRELSCTEALRWDHKMNKHGGYWSNMIEHNSRSVIHYINITFDNYVKISKMHARNGMLRSKQMCIWVLLQFCKYYNNAGGQSFFFPESCLILGLGFVRTNLFLQASSINLCWLVEIINFIYV